MKVLGSEEAAAELSELWQKELWKSITFKKVMNEDVNDFLNSLTEDEFGEFVRHKAFDKAKLAHTGRESEVSKLTLKEQML